MSLVTLAQIAEWRRALREDGDGEFLDPTIAQVIAPKLMDGVDKNNPTPTPIDDKGTI